MLRNAARAALVALCLSLLNCSDNSEISMTSGGASGSAGAATTGGASAGGASGQSGSGGIAGASGTATTGAAAGASAGSSGAGTAGTGEGGAGGDGPMGLGGCGSDDPIPPDTWQEHWFEHEQLVSRMYFDGHVAVYFDADVNVEESEWLYDFMSKVWQYSKQTYGCMGSDLLYAIFHQDKYSGGHPSYYYSDSHDNRNVADQGTLSDNGWAIGNYDLASHEVAHIVESTASHTKFGSPAFGLWGDSKWAEFYQYDLYLALGMDAEAERVFDKFTNTSDSFPVAGTHWFRDWFYPLWRDHGHAQVMVNFFGLLEEHYAPGSQNMGAMNWGEYIHFMSGAAGTNLKQLATDAFGWPGDWDAQFSQAQLDFPDITY